jgi:hypothetical protein
MPIAKHNARHRTSGLGWADYQAVIVSLGAVRHRQMGTEVGRITLVGRILRICYRGLKLRGINARFFRS